MILAVRMRAALEVIWSGLIVRIPIYQFPVHKKTFLSGEGEHCVEGEQFVAVPISLF